MEQIGHDLVLIVLRDLLGGWVVLVLLEDLVEGEDVGVGAVLDVLGGAADEVLELLFLGEVVCEGEVGGAGWVGAEVDEGALFLPVPFLADQHLLG